jgi:hypothetical protein
LAPRANTGMEEPSRTIENSQPQRFIEPYLKPIFLSEKSPHKYT